MRYLNKLVFINSATIPYAEVLVNGNVHLIGTQGVGKSTLLRAILFFYNADTLKLGISREKKSFAEYYFPYQNSYIIYEVVRETGSYCIIAFKSQGKVCFRFFDAAYERRFFLTEAGQAFEKWEDTRQLFDSHSIAYTRKIDRYEEYRDIIYGNTDTVQKELARYAILQSRQYQNIPRTVQNVFLNSKLEAEFIKQTIIMSLNEEEIKIDLQNYSHHLKNFEEQLHDIHQYKQPVTQKLSGQVIKVNQSIRHLESEKRRLAQQLAWAAAQVERQIPKVHNRLKHVDEEKEVLEQRIENAVVRHRSKAEKIKGELSVVENQLKQAKEKREYYDRLGIELLMERVDRKGELEARVRSLDKELALLNQRFGEVAHKHDALLAAHDNSTQAFLQDLEKEQLNITAKLLQQEKDLRKLLEQDLHETRKANQEAEDQRAEQVALNQQALMEARLKREGVLHSRFRETELQTIQQQITELSLSTREAAQKLEHIKHASETIRKHWELDEAKAKQETAQRSERIQEELNRQVDRFTEIENRLANSARTLYGWLNIHVPGWEQHIGKITDEGILFNQDLSPVLSGKGHSFYGVEINLHELPVKVKSITEYEAERNKLTQSIEQIKAEQNSLQLSLDEQLEKLAKKYKPKLRAYKDNERELRYQLERDIDLLKNEQLKLKDVTITAEEEKKQAVHQCDVLIAEANDKLVEAQLIQRKAMQELQKRIETRERETERQVKALENEAQEQRQKIEDNRRQYAAEAQKKRDFLLETRNREMASKGADTKHITKVEQELKELNEELQFIEKNRDTIVEYKKDKRELIDRMSAFKVDIQLLEQQYQTEEQRHQNQQERYRAELQQIKDHLGELQLQLRQLEEDRETFAHFSLTSVWSQLNDSFKQERETFKTDRRCKAIIEDLNRCINSLHLRWDELKETSNRFLGSFSANNIFSFKPLLTYHDEYQLFADQLDEFVSNNKIAEFEKRLNERFATIILSVGKETDTLMSKAHDIQKVINDINRDFDSKNFVTAIQKIELRVDESANTIVRLLLQIKKYNDEYAIELGALNLFSSVDQDAKNRKAIDLLKQLTKAIAEQKSDSIALSDTFELKFRVEENQNDSGWVEKLSNVGSDGTDVLVKAMINIMLLNVFKEGASRRFKEFRLHCMMDEIGKLHPVNVKGILQFANDRNINLVNGSPTEHNALDYKHIYRLERDGKRNTRIKRIITNHALA